MDEVVRMACELGIDRIQPLRCDRCVPQADHRPERWATIIREAVEQCERLWTPPARSQDLSQWMGDERGQRLVGVTRETAPPALDQWLRHQANPVQLTWLMVGPEGGWTEEELKQFRQTQIQPVRWDQPSCAVPRPLWLVPWNWFVGVIG